MGRRDGFNEPHSVSPDIITLSGMFAEVSRSIILSRAVAKCEV